MTFRKKLREELDTFFSRKNCLPSPYCDNALSDSEQRIIDLVREIAGKKRECWHGDDSPIICNSCAENIHHNQLREEILRRLEK